MNNTKMLYLIELTLLKEFMLIKQVHQKSVIFVTISISNIIVLSVNQMSVIDVLIYQWCL